MRSPVVMSHLCCILLALWFGISHSEVL